MSLGMMRGVATRSFTGAAASRRLVAHQATSSSVVSSRQSQQSVNCVVSQYVPESNRWKVITNRGLRRAFSSAAAPAPSVAVVEPKLVAALKAEVTHETSNYQPAQVVTTFLQKHPEWQWEDKEGDINMTLRKTVGNMKISVEFQVSSPSFSGEEDEENPPENADATDFSVTIEKGQGAGATFFCTTVSGDEKYRFMVGNVRYFNSAAERESATAYTGPEFEDLDENLQTGVDDWLAANGVNEELCSFIDAMAVDKEQREYIRWLKSFLNLMQH